MLLVLLQLQARTSQATHRELAWPQCCQLQREDWMLLLRELRLLLLERQLLAAAAAPVMAAAGRAACCQRMRLLL